MNNNRIKFMLVSETKYGSISYNKNEDGIGNILSQGILWDADIIENKLQSYIKNSKVILDIGAHVGCHSIAYSKINSNCLIYSFEMQSEMFYLLEKNINDNNIKNVKLYNNAVGNITGEFETEIKLRDGGYYKPVKYYTNDKFNFGGLGLGIGGDKVNMITIDSLNLESCDFIKIDVEGFEYGVILGALETIKKFKPVIFYEYADKYMTPEMCNIANIEYNTNLNPKDILIEIGYNSFDCSIKGNVIASILL
jgi:FkbM family methyltransferase